MAETSEQMAERVAKEQAAAAKLAAEQEAKKSPARAKVHLSEDYEDQPDLETKSVVINIKAPGIVNKVKSAQHIAIQYKTSENGVYKVPSDQNIREQLANGLEVDASKISDKKILEAKAKVVQKIIIQAGGVDNVELTGNTDTIANVLSAMKKHKLYKDQDLIKLIKNSPESEKVFAKVFPGRPYPTAEQGSDMQVRSKPERPTPVSDISDDLDDEDLEAELAALDDKGADSTVASEESLITKQEDEASISPTKLGYTLMEDTCTDTPAVVAPTSAPSFSCSTLPLARSAFSFIADDSDKRLFDAIKAKNVDDVASLIKSGANVNKPHDNETPLHAAAVSGNVEIVCLLLEAGATPEDTEVPRPLPISEEEKEIASRAKI